MTDEDFRARRAELLLAEVRENRPRPIYISIANEEGFQGGYFLNAFGPISANLLMHALDWYPRGGGGCETMMTECEAAPPPEMMYRRLTREEVESL